MLRTITISIMIVTLSVISIMASAESPCTQLGHNSLGSLGACAAASRGSGLPDSHHRQMVNILSRDDLIPPHPYPVVWSTSIPSNLMIVNGPYYGTYYGLRYSYRAYPSSLSYYNSFFYGY